jgi:hypothetical protein
MLHRIATLDLEFLVLKLGLITVRVLSKFRVVSFPLRVMDVVMDPAKILIR